MDLFGKKINFLGDSITEGCGVALPENRFVDRIAAQVDAICRNYGIGGTRIARQQVPSGEPIWDLYFASRVEDMEADADLAVVFGGTNDCGHGDAPLGTMEDRTEDTFYGGLHVLYSALLRKFPRVVVLTPLHRLNEEAFSPNLETYVKIVREVAGFYQLPVLDLYACSAVDPADPDYVPDGLHPNDKGHAVLAAEILDFLKDL